MSEDMPEALKAIDSGVLTEVARRSLGLPAFRLIDWFVSPLLHEKVIETTGGLFCFRGSGWDGIETKPWSAVLKIVNQPENGCRDLQELCYWKREMLAYQTGMLSALPDSVRSPQCYGVSEHGRSGWIWLENIQETTGPVWTLTHFQRAACQLGQFAGIYLVSRPIPDTPWLCGSLFRSFYVDDGWWARFMNPASHNNAWQRPVVQSVFPERLRAKVLQIWAEKWKWITANEHLPQVFCHNDAHRRNLMLHDNGNGQEELVAFDWAFCGPGGLGNDLGELIGTSLSYFAVDPANAGELEAAVLEGYLAGLHVAGWSGDERLVRLGYLISLALYWGGTLPCEVALMQPGATKVNVEAKYGRPVEILLPGWTHLAEFALDRADEARYWMGRIF
jgi:hypothetical protein